MGIPASQHSESRLLRFATAANGVANLMGASIGSQHKSL
jgi:hypothetical protein